MVAVCNRVIIITDGKIVLDTHQKSYSNSPLTITIIHIYFKKSPPTSLQKDIKTINWYKENNCFK